MAFNFQLVLSPNNVYSIDSLLFHAWLMPFLGLEHHFVPTWKWRCQCCMLISSVQISRSVVSDSLRPHELQHARPPCPSPTPGVHSKSRLSSQWCHPAISSSVIPFSSCPQSLPASGSFPMSQLFTWGDQSIGVSALASVLPMNTQDWSPTPNLPLLWREPCLEGAFLSTKAALTSYLRLLLL